MLTAHPHRYHRLAIALHWVMAAAFFCMLASGLLMTDLEDKSLQFQIYQWHKSLGVILLLAFFLRLWVRLLTHPPALPENFPRLEKWAAKAGHWGLYAVMVLMPLSGWVMVSASPYGLPTIVFGWFAWPHLPGITANAAIEDGAKTAHEILANVFMFLIAAHVAATIKHYAWDRENLLRRMWFR